MNLSAMASQKSLSTEEKCIAYLEKMRWPEGVRCPTCGNTSISRFQIKTKAGKNRHLYQCLGKTCRYQFSPTTGTIFHDSHLPLNKWFRAIALVSDADKPMSTNQLRLALGVQYKTAAHLASRIRQAMENGSIELAAGPVESSPDAEIATPAQPQQGRSVTAQKPGSGTGSAARPGRENRISTSIAQRRAETADLLSHISPKSGTASSTAVDNVLSMFVSMAQMSVRPPLFFVKYLRDKVFT
jgi:transposase-like protein